MTAAPVIVAIPDNTEPHSLLRANDSDVPRLLEGETMGTYWNAHFFAPIARSDSYFRNPIEQALTRIVNQMSHWEPDSDLSRFNASPEGRWQALPAEFFRVLNFALEVADDTGGAFNPSVGPVVDAWGFGPAGKTENVPRAPQLQQANCIQIDCVNRKAKHTGNPGLDFSAVAKGFAVDEVGRVLRFHGVSSYLVEIGGELRAFGLKPNGEPWWVAIEPPGVEWVGGFPEIRIALSGWSIATTGDYRRYFEANGRRWSHTIDPRSGTPVDHNIASVSVIHKDCMAADAYSTALMVMGAEEGIQFAERSELAALFVLRVATGLSVRCTESFLRMLS